MAFYNFMVHGELIRSGILDNAEKYLADGKIHIVARAGVGEVNVGN